MKDRKVMQAMVTSFFKKLYTTDPGVRLNEVVHLFQQCMSDETDASLCKEFSEQEISNALFQISPLKAFGPNGFPTRFFQQIWEVIKGDVVITVKKFFDIDEMLSSVNETTIVLLPKKEGPKLLRNYKPISLCNFIYKVVSKCLVNRLRPLLNDLIGPMQSAFISRRPIIDNALITFECLHAMEQGNSPCKEYGAL
jgi:hypothetical protein